MRRDVTPATVALGHRSMGGWEARMFEEPKLGLA